MTEPDDIALRAFCDVLLPGGGAWPAASTALVECSTALGLIAEADRAWLGQAASRIAALGPGERVAAMQTLEQAEPARFGRILSALYAAYYSAPAVHAEVTRLAEAGPREASPHFDTRLLQQVITTQVGRRRL